MTPEARANEYFVEVQCRVAKEGDTRREWEIQLGKDVGEPVDEKLVEFLEKSVNRKGSVKVHCPINFSLGDDYS